MLKRKLAFHRKQLSESQKESSLHLPLQSLIPATPRKFQPQFSFVSHVLQIIDVTMEEPKSLNNGLELVKSVTDKHLDLLRPSSRYYSMFKGLVTDAAENDKGKYTLIRDVEDLQPGIYDKPLRCFGCGIGWFSFLLGFVFPLMWYYGTFLYLGNYYRKDPRERAGLAASAIAALACSVSLLIIAVALLFF